MKTLCHITKKLTNEQAIKIVSNDKDDEENIINPIIKLNKV
jgi:hypothetical protein